MIIISEQEFLDNQSSIEEFCATHNAKVIPGDNGGQWKPFRGGDTLKQGSHWWVKFQIL